MAEAAHASERRNEGYLDLRELVERFDEMGELARVKGADWKLEIGALSETIAAAKPGRAKALLFDEIPGYPKGFRILSGAANAYRRLAVVLGLPEPTNEMDLVKAYRARAKQELELMPPVEVKDGPILENIDRDEAVDLLKFPAPFVHEGDGGRYIGTDDLVVMRDPDTGWTLLSWQGTPLGGEQLADPAAGDPTGESLEEVR